MKPLLKLIYFCTLCFFLISLSFAKDLSLPKITLKIALYPDIPDSCHDNFVAYNQRLKSEFEALYPEINLELIPVLDPYNYNYLVDLLKEVDILELDSAFLGQMITEERLAPWLEDNYLFDGWTVAVSLFAEYTHPFAYPHWQCGHFLFAREPLLQDITDINSFLKQLNNVPKNQQPLAWNLNANSEINDAFIDGFSGWCPLYQSTAQCSITQAANETLATFQKLLPYTCTNNTDLSSLNGNFEAYEQAAAKAFANNEIAYFIGYSEDFADIAEQISNKIAIDLLHAPWGIYNQLIVIIDSLVLPKEIDVIKHAYAQKWAKYLTSASTYQWIVLGEDCPDKSHPRYLIPAKSPSEATYRVLANPIMKKIFEIVDPKNGQYQPSVFPEFFLRHTTANTSIINTIQRNLQKSDPCLNP